MIRRLAILALALIAGCEACPAQIPTAALPQFAVLSKQGPQDGLAAWWPFDSVANSTTFLAQVGGFGLYGQTSQNLAGWFDGAFDTWNGSSRIQIRSAAGICAFSNAFSVSVWRKRKSATITAPGGETVVARTVNTGGFNASVNSFILYDSSFFGNGPSFGVCKGSSTSFAYGTSVVHTNWQHLAGTYDGTTVRLYVDGVLQATTASVAAPVNGANTATVNVNQYQGGYDTQSDQLIDDFRIYDRALTQDEISHLARTGGPR